MSVDLAQPAAEGRLLLVVVQRLQGAGRDAVPLGVDAGPLVEVEAHECSFACGVDSSTPDGRPAFPIRA
ncbi:hypothetical protein Cus16_0573 [Curtobacterium sp. ER1/6]|nr:hypothetical protein Cus16_0573 [Curtobacterium sp. ER1/6]